MQSDINRNTGRQILEAGGHGTNSLIAHELRKSNMYEVKARHLKDPQSDLATTIDQLQREK